MAEVVYAVVPHIEDLQDPKVWRRGDQSSYAITRGMTRTDYRNDLRVIGRRDKNGAVSIIEAEAYEGEWVPVNTWTLTLALFFAKKLDEQLDAGSNTLDAFIEAIDDERSCSAARQLIAAECGAGLRYAKGNALAAAVNTVSLGLKALGIPAGDWTFCPMVLAYDPEASF